jgi:hypothetical protein
MTLCGCEGTTFRSSVPRAAVNIAINTQTGAFVHFKPECSGSYLTVTEEGYFLNGQRIQGPNERDRWGYGGVLVYINAWSNYDAYDLACPDCCTRGQRVRCECTGATAVCPNCGEEYNLFDGTAFPQKGSKEALLRLSVVPSGDVLLIRQ